jgi:hypothetical protein
MHWKRSQIISYQKSLICAKTRSILDTQAFGGYWESFWVIYPPKAQLLVVNEQSSYSPKPPKVKISSKNCLWEKSIFSVVECLFCTFK